MRSVIFDDLTGLRLVLAISLDKAKKHHLDSCYLIVGKEGRGKSTVLLHASDIHEILTGKSASIESIAPDLPEFIDALQAGGCGDLIALDEGEKLASINTLDKLSRAMVEAFKVMRAKAFITMICFTNPLKINTYFREDRVRGIFYCKRLGEVWYFSHGQLIKEIIPALMKGNATRSIERLSSFKPRFIMHYKKYTGKLLEEYTRRKHLNIDDILDDLKKDYGKTSNNMTAEQVARSLRIAKQSVYNLINKGLLKAEIITMAGGVERYKIRRSDVDEYRHKYSRIVHSVVVSSTHTQSKDTINDEKI